MRRGSNKQKFIFRWVENERGINGDGYRPECGGMLFVTEQDEINFLFNLNVRCNPQIAPEEDDDITLRAQMRGLAKRREDYRPQRYPSPPGLRR